uniref:Uncharacterized protein n=1 Tax=Amphimedon queenslandica TaxID=400682 RepID=A0A1X7UJJ9_AMPQE
MAGDTGSDRSGSSQGTYEKYTPTEKAKIANFAILHGTAAALRHFSKEYPRLKWSIVNDWLIKDGGVNDIKAYITIGGGVVTLSIVISAATGILMARHPLSQECNGGHFFLKKGWAKCFLKEINFVKRKATTKAKVSVENIDELERRYLIDIKAAVPIDDIPRD